MTEKLSERLIIIATNRDDVEYMDKIIEINKWLQKRIKKQEASS